MLTYWFLFGTAAWMAVNRSPLEGRPSGRWPDLWRVMFVLLVLIVGLRHEVGADWSLYAEYVERARYETFLSTVWASDPAYGLLNWLAARTGLGLYFVNTVCAAIFSWGLIEFCRAQPRPWLAMTVAIPYLVIVVAMGYTRQGTAIGLGMLGLVALSERRLLRFMVFVALAATFHKSAVILMPLAVLAGTRYRLWTTVWVGVASLIFYDFLLQGSVESLRINYIDAQYLSKGAAVRVAMNAVPAIIFLWLRRKFVMPQSERLFWTWMSVGALGLVGWLAASPSSTAVDRVALYWIPLQLLVLSRLPEAFESTNRSKRAVAGGVAAYSAAVQFVWLAFGVHAQYWVPYKSYLWLALWK